MASSERRDGFRPRPSVVLALVMALLGSLAVAASSRSSHAVGSPSAPIAPAVDPPPECIVETSAITVNATGDDGVGCTIRDAVTLANSTPGAQTVVFDIEGSAPHTIQPTSPLPRITETVTLDATTQPGFAGTPVVELDGSLAGTGNTASGLRIAAPDVEVRGFAINRFGWSGIEVSGATGALIVGNHIGTDPTGTASGAGNARDGITLNAATDAVIGGTDPADGNVISGNGVTGVYVTASGHQILGNHIGTDVTGSSAIPNQVGIQIIGGGIAATGNTVGGTSTGAGNVISGNTSHGVLMNTFAADTTQQNTISGNLIGTDVSGGALGNGGHGVFVQGGSGVGRNTIGGEAAGAGNVIAHNGAAGVGLGTSTSENEVLGNSIFANAGLGIDHGVDGTPNATANGGRAFPVITAVEATSSGGDVSGTVTGPPSSPMRVELFASGACDASGHGEGAVHLGAVDVTTDTAGGAGFDASFPSGFVTGDSITATVTDADGNTSEFSACRTAPTAAPLGDDIVFSGQRDGERLLFVFDLDADSTSPLLGTTNATAPVWSPDGEQIAYAASGGLYTVTPATGAVTTLVEPGALPVAGAPVTPTWSPDGSWVAFTNANVDLWVVEVGTGIATQLTDDAFVDSNPAWGPDGRLAWRSNRAPERVWVAGFDPSGPALTGPTGLANSSSVPSQQREMDWSPDGSTLVLGAAVNAAAGDDLYLLPTDGVGPLVQLTDDPGEDSSPSFSPDGATVVFTSDRSGEPELHIVPTSGGPGDESLLLARPGIDASPDWGRSAPVPEPGGREFLAVAKAGDGTGLVIGAPGPINCWYTCAAAYPTGTVVTLTATADAGSVFVGWSGAGCSGTGDCVVTVDAFTEVTATFALIANQAADLEITKSGPVSAVVGEELTYDITVVNTGSDTATNVQVIDVIPSGLEFVSVDPGPPVCTEGQRVVCDLGSLASQASTTVTIVARGIEPGDVQNDVDVTSDQPDPDPDDNTSSWITRIDPEPPVLTVVKGHRVETGPRVVFTIDVTNLGPSPAPRTIARDLVPDGWTLIDVTTTHGTCDTRVVCNLGTLQVDETATVEITISVLEITGPIDNEVTVTCDGCGRDFPGGTRVDEFPYPVVSKLREGDFVAGGRGTYLIDVANIGTGPTTDAIIVTDTLPDGMAFESAVGEGFECTPTGQVIRCIRQASLAPGATVTIVLTVELGDEPLAAVTNTVSIGGGGGISQPDPSTDTGPIDPPRPPVLGIVKEVEEESVRVGSPLTYEITVTNTGGSDATNVRVIDELPATVDLAAVEPADDCGGTRTITCDLGGLAPGESVRVRIEVVPREVTILTNEAITFGDGIDPVGGTATTTVDPAPRVGVRKAVSEPVVLQDSEIVYEITAFNEGPGDATDLQIIDPLPRGVTLLSVEPSTEDGMTCNVVAPPEIDDLSEAVVCTIPELPELAVTELVLRVRVLQVGPLENTACVEAPGVELLGGGCDGTRVPVVTAPVTGSKFHDVDADGVRDDGEPGLEGWEIRAYRDDDGDGVLGDGEDELVRSATTSSTGTYSLLLPPGDYVVCEVRQDGWEQTAPAPDAARCGTWIPELATGGWAVTVTDSSVITGRDFGNTVPVVPGTIIVEKQTIPDGATTPFRFDGALSGSIRDGEQLSAEVPPGSYTVSEILPDDLWSLVSIECDDDDSGGDLDRAAADFVVDPGETVTCVFTNRGLARVTITKRTVPGGGGPFEFRSGVVDPVDGWDAAVVHFELGDGESSTFEIAAGVPWTVTEPAPDGWVLTGVDCGGHPRAAIDGPTVTTDLVVGDDVSCVYTNEARADVTIRKLQRIDDVVPVFTTDPVDAEPGDHLTYRLEVTNAGPLDAAEVVVVDDLDPRLRPRPGESFPDGCTFGVELTCELGTVGSGTTVVLELPLQIVHPSCDVMGTRFDDDGDDRPALRGTAGPEVMCGAGGGDLISAAAGDDEIWGYLPPSPALDLSDVVNVAEVSTSTPESSSDNTSNEVVARLRHSVDTDDTVFAGDGDDVVYGQDAGDTLNGQNGDDRVSGGPGDDLVAGQVGDDRLSGNDGDDDLFGQDGDDVLRGGNGDDDLFGQAGRDALAGQDGDDRVNGGSGNDRLDGGNGDDDLVGLGGADVISGGAGNDLADGGGQNDRMYGGPGRDVLRGSNGNDRIWGDVGTSPDARFGDPDHLDGGRGNDRLYGQGGDDRRGFILRSGVPGGLYGGPGNDILWGGFGEDDVRGFDGRDIIDGGPQDDTLRGGPGNDVVRGQSGNDIVGGGPGNDELFGGRGSDLVEGNEGRDRLAGDVGTDPDAGGSPDQLTGGDGDDLLLGQGGDDGWCPLPPGQQAGCTPVVFYAGAGFASRYVARLEGDRGRDAVHGGRGHDWVGGGGCLVRRGECIRADLDNRLYGSSGVDLCTLGPQTGPQYEGTDRGDRRDITCETPANPLSVFTALQIAIWYRW